MYPFSDGHARSVNMVCAVASVGSRAAATLRTEAMESALHSVKKLSLMQAVIAVHLKPRPEFVFMRCKGEEWCSEGGGHELQESDGGDADERDRESGDQPSTFGWEAEGEEGFPRWKWKGWSGQGREPCFPSL